MLTKNDLNQIQGIISGSEKRLTSEVKTVETNLRQEIASAVHSSELNLKEEIASAVQGSEINLRQEIASAVQGSEMNLRQEIASAVRQIHEDIGAVIDDSLLPIMAEKADIERLERKLSGKVAEHDQRIADIESIPTIAHQLKRKK